MSRLVERVNKLEARHGIGDDGKPVVVKIFAGSNHEGIAAAKREADAKGESLFLIRLVPPNRDNPWAREA